MPIRGSSGGGGGGGSTTQDYEVIIATAGQTVFNLGFTYATGVNKLMVYQNGQRLSIGTNYTESSSTQVTVVEAATLNDEFIFHYIA